MRSVALENLISLINSANSAETPISLEDVDVSAPYEINQGGFDTEVTVTPKADFLPLRGAQTFRYLRRAIGSVVKGDLELYSDPEMRTSYDLIPFLNEQLGIQLLESDIINDPITGTDHTFRAASLSYEWKDATVVKLKQATKLAEVIPVTELNGLVYPDTQAPKGQASVYSYGVDCSHIRSFLEVMAAGVAIDDTALAVEFNKTVPEVWQAVDEVAAWNLRDAQCTYEGPTADVVGANPAFERVVFIELSDKCSNFAGTLLLHYNRG